MKANIGSGGDYKDGFVNLERFLQSTHHKGETDQPDVVGDAHYLPFKDNSFKKVAIVHVLEHLEYPIDALREIHRVLEDGGLLYLEVPNASNVNNERDDHLYSWTKWTLHNIARKVGFEITEYNAEGNSNGPSQMIWCTK